MPTTELRILSATAADLAAVARIYAHYVAGSVVTFDEVAPAAADWHRRLDDLTTRGLPFLVARTGEEIAGYGYAGPWRPKPAYRHTVEDSIYLSPDRTGQGIGGALLTALLIRSAAAGARQMVAVIADTGSGASVALHQAHGFGHAGRLSRVGYKHDRWIDTILMQRDLTAGPDPRAPTPPADVR